MPRYTEGPWIVLGEDTFDLHMQSVGTEDGSTIAHVETWDGMDQEEQDIAQNNAQLIAAAPELYEALKALLDGTTRAHVEAAKRAVRKAEGK